MSKSLSTVLRVLVLAGLVSLCPAPAVHAISTFTSDTALEPSGFSDLIAHPNDFWSWDLTNITYKFDSSFTSNSAIRSQVRLAFQQWDTANATANGSNYSYNRAGGYKPFGDIRSIAVHEIGHVLGLHHPDQADAVGRNYGLAGGGGLVAQADANNEVLRSWINGGDYNHVLSHDELDSSDYLYGHDLNFTEVTGGATANILIKAGVSGGSSIWATGGPDSGFYRNGADHYQGVRSTAGVVTFNTASSTPMGFKTLGINWDYQNPTGQATLGFKVRTSGTNNPDPVFHYDGSAAEHFNSYGTSPVSSNAKDDLMHTWSSPFPGPFPASDVIHVGIEQDVWDWTVVSAKVVTSGGETSAPLLSFHEWDQTVVGVGAAPGAGDSGITTLGPITVLARGLRLINSEETPAEIMALGLAVVDDLDLALSDLNRTTLNRLQREQRLQMIPDFRMTLDDGQDFFLLFDGEPEGIQNFVPVANGPELLNHELFVFAETRLGDAIVGNYALVGRPPIVGVPEPSTLILLAALGLSGLIAFALRRR